MTYSKINVSLGRAINCLIFCEEIYILNKWNHNNNIETDLFCGNNDWRYIVLSIRFLNSGCDSLQKRNRNSRYGIIVKHSHIALGNQHRQYINIKTIEN